jgi:phosphoserine phosphatase
MTALPSIGTPVSFFYQLSNQPLLSDSPLAWLNTTDCYAVHLHQDTLYLQSNHALALPGSDGFDIVIQPPVAVLRLFGVELNWLAVKAVLAVLGFTRSMYCRVYRPHPMLAGAVELSLAQALTASALQALSDVAQQAGIELVYLPARPRLTEPGVLVMDMDSTAIQIECIDEIATLAGVGEQVAAVTARAMNGELDFAQSLVARVAALRGAPESVLHQVLAEVPLMPGLTDLVAYLQQQHWKVAIASGGFTFFTDALKQRLGLTATFANVLEIQDGKLTGKVLGDIVDATTKAEVVRLLAEQHAIPSTQTVAIGDGANDIPMLNAAALGVAFHAKPKVQAQAKAAIRQGSLLQLLYLLDL